MSLAPASAAYSREEQNRLRADLDRRDRQNLKRGRDIEMGAARIILQSPDGSRFALAVANDGTLSATAL